MCPSPDDRLVVCPCGRSSILADIAAHDRSTSPRSSIVPAASHPRRSTSTWSRRVSSAAIHARIAASSGWEHSPAKYRARRSGSSSSDDRGVMYTKTTDDRCRATRRENFLEDPSGSLLRKPLREARAKCAQGSRHLDLHGVLGNPHDLRRLGVRKTVRSTEVEGHAAARGKT